MVRFIAVGVILFAVMAFALNAGAVENKGAAQISIDGGSRGAVTFPHHEHQTRLGDCMICHKTFAQETGSIEKAKAEGKLVPKQVMNKLCLQCHRAEKKAGKSAGPTTCNKCHTKEQ